MITGGTGGLGLLFAGALFDLCRARLALTARWVPPPEETWPERARQDDRIGRSLAGVLALKAARSGSPDRDGRRVRSRPGRACARRDPRPLRRPSRRHPRGRGAAADPRDRQDAGGRRARVRPEGPRRVPPRRAARRRAPRRVPARLVAGVAVPRSRAGRLRGRQRGARRPRAESRRRVTAASRAPRGGARGRKWASRWIAVRQKLQADAARAVARDERLPDEDSTPIDHPVFRSRARAAGRRPRVPGRAPSRFLAGGRPSARRRRRSFAARRRCNLPGPRSSTTRPTSARSSFPASRSCARSSWRRAGWRSSFASVAPATTRPSRCARAPRRRGASGRSIRPGTFAGLRRPPDRSRVFRPSTGGRRPPRAGTLAAHA